MLATRGAHCRLWSLLLEAPAVTTLSVDGEARLPCSLLRWSCLPFPPVCVPCGSCPSTAVKGEMRGLELVQCASSGVSARAGIVGGDILRPLQARSSSGVSVEPFLPSLPKQGVSWIAHRSVAHSVTLVLDRILSIATWPCPSLIIVTATRLLGL